MVFAAFILLTLSVPLARSFSLIFKMHHRFHYGRDRALYELNRLYRVNRAYAEGLLARIKEQCVWCHRRVDWPKNPPDTPITSMDFGERILVDLKQLSRASYYLVVAICHWSSHCWLGLLASKHAEGVAKFLEGIVFEDVRRIRAGWKGALEEAKRTRKGGVSFPVNPEKVKTDATGSIFTVSVSQKHEDILQVGSYLSECII